MAAASKKTFEDALAEIEKVIARLEDRELTLDSALKNFEKGVELLRTCDAHLQRARGRLEELVKDENGEFIRQQLGIGPAEKEEDGAYE